MDIPLKYTKYMNYKNTQIGTLIIYVLFGIILLYGFIFFQGGISNLIIVTMVFVLLILISFVTLTITIDQTNLQIKFGYGIYKKKFPLQEIISAKSVKNKWYYGWGIRYWFWPKMRIFNVSGFDAVEIHMKNKTIYRIGTDEPQKLESVILQSIK